MISFASNTKIRRSTTKLSNKVTDNKTNKVSGRISMKRKAAIVMVLMLLLSFGTSVQAYVLKSNGKEGTECVFFAGKKTNLKQKGKTIKGLGHGNDMTYRKLDGKLYVAPMNQNYIIRMATDGTVEAKIKTTFPRWLV